MSVQGFEHAARTVVSLLCVQLHNVARSVQRVRYGLKAEIGLLSLNCDVSLRQ